MKTRLRSGFVFLFGLTFLFLVSSTAFAVDNDECLACHDQMKEDLFTASVHGKNLCTSCHSDITEVPHQEKLKKVNCGSCHKIEQDIYLNSDHGKAVKAGELAANCVICHGQAHEILSARDSKSPMYRMNIPKTCGACHEDASKMKKFSLLEDHPVMSYEETVHGQALMKKGILQSAVCTDCHGSHDLHAPTNPESKIFRQNVPATCGKCHENVFQTYKRSIHGKSAIAGKVESPVCTDCHGEHNIRAHTDPKSRVYATNVSEKVCGDCHGAERIIAKYRLPSDRVKTYLESYHGIASHNGATTVANCASCHGAHDILPSSDPLSSVNKNNLPQTCGKCHPNVSEQLAKGSIHLAPSPDQDRVVFWVSFFYVLLIVLVIGGMVIHNCLDFFRKFHEHYHRHMAKRTGIRFTKGERIQHAVLAFCFILLAYTGFALKYSDAWWAYPFTWIGGDLDWRGIIHRGAAAVFTLLCIYHLLNMILTKRGREQVKAMAVRVRDFLDVIQMFKHNLTGKTARPKFARYGYIEKAEYWALIWGSIIMILTGGFLVFENFTMQHFPKWFMDVVAKVHFYEAVLATLAILVWHFYFVIFDPEHYPLNLSMSTGRETEDREDDTSSKKKSENPPS